MGKQEQLRFASIEGLRLVSSLGVLIHHFLPYATRSGMIFGGSLQICVDLFFVISGIVIAKAYSGRVSSWREYALFMQRRLARLYPLHIATALFFIGVGILSHKGLLNVNGPHRYDFRNLPANLLLVHAWTPYGTFSFNQVTWSISAELFCYLVFPLLAMTIMPKVRFGFILVVVVTIACAWLTWFLYRAPFIKVITTTGQFRALPSFCFGIWLAAIEPSLARFVPKKVAPTGALALSAGTLLLAAWNWHYHLLLAVWALVAVVYAADVSRAKTIFSGKALYRGGRLTYSIYMIHPVIQTVFLAYAAPKILGDSTLAGYASVFIAIIATFVLAEISFRYFEEPLRQRLGKPLFRAPISL